ncbi:MAG TPA: hypothetical protein VLL73_01450 [Desulfurivibrionaceae bacterium]|nr:hypothetical protein [Desulfurivibrionaceae bacterium]
MRYSILLGMLAALLLVGGCSTKDGVGTTPPAKGGGCSLGLVRVYG